MTDTPMPDWVLLEAAKRGGWHWTDYNIEELHANHGRQREGYGK